MYGYKYTHAYMHVYMCIFEVGPQKKTEFIHKKLCYFYMFKLQSPSKYCPLIQYTSQDIFFYCSKQFLNSSILMPFSASAVFCFTSSTSAKHFPLRTFFIQANKKIVTWGEIE